MVLMAGLFLCMDDGIEHDVPDVVVVEAVGDLAASTLGRDDLRSSQHPEVLRHKRLAGVECFGQLVDAPGLGVEL